MEILNKYGFLVDTAEDGAEAVEKVKNSTAAGYDLVLMDVQIPVTNGYVLSVEQIMTEILMRQRIYWRKD